MARQVSWPDRAGGARPPPGARRHQRGTAAVPRLCQRAVPGTARARQLLGLQPSRLVRAGAAVRRFGSGRRVQGNDPCAARGGYRGHPRHGLQSHGGGGRERLDAVDEGHRQRHLLPPRPRRPVALRELHRLRQHSPCVPSRGQVPDPRLPALLGARNEGRRLSLRPGHGAGSRRGGLRPPRALVRRHPLGSGARLRQDDRRALGPGARRLPPWGVPARLVGVERSLSRLPARLLARRQRPGCRIGGTAGRLERSLPSRWPQAVGQHQLRHGPRRVHPCGPRELQRPAQRGQPGGQCRRPPGQPQLELRRRGGNRRPRRRGAAAETDAQHALDAAAFPGRPHDPGGR